MSQEDSVDTRSTLVDTFVSATSETEQEEARLGHYPAWAKTLLLLLDYAIYVGARRKLEHFVCILEMARHELQQVCEHEVERCGRH